VRITCVGAGPAGLYFAILAKLRNPAHDVTVIERHGPRQSRGWSITLGAGNLEKLYIQDPESARAIERDMYRWREEYLSIRGQRVLHVSDIDIMNVTRPRLVEILADRARELGARVRYNEEISSVSQLADADLIVAADGVGSSLRSEIGTFGTEITLSSDKYIWLGTDRPLGTFEYFFVETPCGWVWAAGYGVQSERSTFLVHCTQRTWSDLGFGTMPVADSLDVIRELFREPLAGYRLIGEGDDENSGRWLSFRTVTNQRWHAGNVVLAGDSAHTIHFSTGLGAVMAIEDAIALADALGRHDRLELGLGAYERQRKAELKPAADAARLSGEWFANIPRYVNLSPQAFAAVLYARGSPLLPLLPPRLWYQMHRAFNEVPMLRQLAKGLYPAARTIRRRKPDERSAGARRPYDP
jgi:2-polyprenyl-6-methoxyphenol hydroxylase-like FAD-dependent oxidoreductase